MSGGQITTAKALDFETRSSYTLTLTATDPSLASASITVNITVTDTDDSATVILLTGNAPEFDAEEMTRSVAENTAAGMAIGDPVTATDVDGDALTYTLGGDDAMYFTIELDGPADDQRPARLRDEDELHGDGLGILGQGRRGGRHDHGDDHGHR